MNDRNLETRTRRGSPIPERTTARCQSISDQAALFSQVLLLIGAVLGVLWLIDRMVSH